MKLKGFECSKGRYLDEASILRDTIYASNTESVP
jgi:hypothetical protein